MQDDFGDRMKAYEKEYTEARITEPFVYARIDGRSFSKFTKNMARPYEEKMSRVMQYTTKYLVEKTHAMIGYTQSDEISLCWHRDKVMFDGKIQKLASVLGGMTSARFVQECESITSPWANIWHPPMDKVPHFDARVIGLPSEDELANAFLWRTKDCVRNSISMVAQSKYSHKSLQGMSTREMAARLEADGWEMRKFPDYFRYGTFWKNETVQRELDESERLKIPDKFRPPPGSLVDRNAVVRLYPELNFYGIKEAVFR